MAPVQNSRSPTDKYLSGYAEPEADRVRDNIALFGKVYRHAVVIPACREQAADIQGVWQHLETAGLLVVVVVNSPSSGDPVTRSLLATLSQGYRVHSADCVLFCTAEAARGGSKPDLLLVDRCTPGREIPARQGVGLARKIGCDILVSLREMGLLESRWIATTDADAILPADYFSYSPASPEIAAIVHPFKHNPTTSALETPVALYELHMLHYAAALRWAGSPYGYPTIGSTIRCSAEHCARVRGFPKRNTGEDFYLLNKLRKTGLVQPADVAPVIITGRLSDRVPIGTGQALGRIAAMEAPLTDFLFDHPGSFSSLKRLLSLLGDIAQGESDRTAEIEVLAQDPELGAFATSSGLLARIRSAASRQPAGAVMHKHLMDWFDALKTRQFIHWMRDHHYGSSDLNGLFEAGYVNLPASQIQSASPETLAAWLGSRFYQMIYSAD
ncbi:MAG: hypothetical protein O3B72_08630 [Proteobacteria bacterium]|nr:hypothetical protein [Pseudomonadota bacterium]